MRYHLSINLNKYSTNPPLNLDQFAISKYLTEGQVAKPETFISIVTKVYARKKPGLLEANWQKPWFDSPSHFLFIGGSILFRMGMDSDRGPVPSPKQVLDVLLLERNKHFKNFKGNYYLVLLDKRSMTIEILSSPLSMFPAFYQFRNGTFTFSNLLESFSLNQSYDLESQAMVELALFDHCLDDNTIYKDVKLVQGGYHLTLTQAGDSKKKLIYDLADWHTSFPKSRKESIEDLNFALQGAIQQYIDQTDSFNIALTGGFDGRLNLSMIQPEYYPKLRAYSYGKKGSPQVTIPQQIACDLNFAYHRVGLEKDFEAEFIPQGALAIQLTGGVTGFNRAIYPYAFNQLKDFNRSCMVGQCDMIRPVFTNPAGVILNEFSHSIFFGTYASFKAHFDKFSKQSFFSPQLFTAAARDAIFENIVNRYIDPYKKLDAKTRFYFFLLKESLMKYWHTEFHITSVFVDYFVPLADLDFLEILFDSAYAGIYKGIFVKHQFQRRSPQDLYVDLMTRNNNRLNFFYNDRSFKPGWLKYGLLGYLLCGAGKQVAKYLNRRPSKATFEMEKWTQGFYYSQQEGIFRPNPFFNPARIKHFLATHDTISDCDEGYRFNRAISTKLWLDQS